jgi:hypothetical protein
MTLLEQLEQELERVRKQLKRLTREQAVLTEQITRLRTGARPEVVCAALEVAFGVRLDLYLLASEGADTDHAAAADRLPLIARKPPNPAPDGGGRLNEGRRSRGAA